MKRLFRLIALLLAALLLTGCHGAHDRPAFMPPAQFDESRTYELTFWAKTESNITQANLYKKAISDFEALYPNVKINLKLFTNYGDIYKEVITNISTNTTPNICITYPDHIATYLTGTNCVVPLDTLFTDVSYGLGGRDIRFDAPELTEMIPEFLEECRFGDHYYAVPYMRSTEACYVNKTYVEKLGYTLPEVLTWDFIWEVSEAAMAKDEDGNYLVNGQPLLIPFIYKSTDNMMIQYLQQKGAGYSTENGEILLFNDDTADFLKTIAGHVKSGAFSTFAVSSYPANWLNAGQCIFAVDSTAGSTWMGSDAPLIDIAEEKMVDFETVVMPAPQLDPGNIQMISQGPSVCVFNKEDPQEVLASWIFVQYLLSNEIQIPYAQTEGYVPVTSKAQSDPAYAEYLSRRGDPDPLYYEVKLDATQLLLDHVDDTFVTPVFNGSASLRDASGQLIEETVKGVRRKKTIDDAFIDSLYDKMVSNFKLDQIIPAGTGQNETAEPEEQTAPDSSAQSKTAELADLGPLPTGTIVLITALIVVWLCIIAFVVCDWLKKRKRAKNK